MRLTNRIIGTMALLAFGLGAQAAAIRYTVTSLGNIPGTPSAINASGQVVGTFARDDRNTFGSFLYSNGQFIDTTDSGANGRGINDAGQMTDGFNTFGINNVGQTITFVGPLDSAQAYLEDGTTQVPLPSSFEPRVLNDLGQVAGNFMVYPGQFAAALFKDGGLTLITPPNGQSAQVTGINNLGHVVGGGMNSTLNGFVFDGTRLHDLGQLGGSFSLPRGINNRDQIVGASTWSSTPGAGLHAFLYENTQMLDLNNLIPNDSDWLLFDAMAINDAGQIVGLGQHDGERELFLLTPASVVPEPTTLAFFSLAAAGYLLRRRIIRR